MRQTIAAGLFLLMLLFLPPWLRAEEPAPQEDTSPQPIQTQQAAPEDGTGSDAAHTLRLWDGSAVQTLTAAEYLPGVVRGEMPATFELEALKAQAVAERTYLYYRMTGTAEGKPVAGGGAGNAIDRVALGAVTDFFKTTFVDFAVFNVADIFVTCGVVLAVVLYWRWDLARERA